MHQIGFIYKITFYYFATHLTAVTVSQSIPNDTSLNP